MSKSIPRDPSNDFSGEIIAERQRFIEENSGATLDHTKRFSFDPSEMSGNIESMFGIAQVPIGIAGPLLINGEHAQGEFYVPMATVEGTMLATPATSRLLRRLQTLPRRSVSYWKSNTNARTISSTHALTTAPAMRPVRT